MYECMYTRVCSYLPSPRVCSHLRSVSAYNFGRRPVYAGAFLCLYTTTASPSTIPHTHTPAPSLTYTRTHARTHARGIRSYARSHSYAYMFPSERLYEKKEEEGSKGRHVKTTCREVQECVCAVCYHYHNYYHYYSLHWCREGGMCCS
jgi:hypothetical protein